MASLAANLAIYEEARAALTRAERLSDTKAPRVLAGTLAYWARVAKDERLLASATRLKLEAERKAGELLAQAQLRGERAGRGRLNKRSSDGTFSKKTLADLGVARKESMRFQALARLDRPEFEARVADATKEALRAMQGGRAQKAQAKKEIRAEREAALGAKQRALPDRKYGVIYADPEWKFEVYSEAGLDRSAENHYPCSDLGTLCARDVASIAADDCVLFLWVTRPCLPQGLSVMSAWGFDYKSCAGWDKETAGNGYWFRDDLELLLVGTRGDVPAPAPGTQARALFRWRKTRHSAKPDAVAEMIEGLFPHLPKIELNRRGAPRPGWSAWGNEAEE